MVEGGKEREEKHGMKKTRKRKRRKCKGEQRTYRVRRETEEDRRRREEDGGGWERGRCGKVHGVKLTNIYELLLCEFVKKM